MKTIIYFILMVLSLAGFSQNGGQQFENSAIKIEYLGYSSNTHTFKVTNKQNCEVTVRTKVDQEQSIDMQISGNGYFYVNVHRSTPENVKFRAKAEGSCGGNPDMGWVELNTNISTLPLKEEIEKKSERDPSKIDVNLRLGILSVVTNNSIPYNQTIEIYNISGVKKYYNKFRMSKNSLLDLNSHLNLGTNFIRVTLENGTINQFMLRVFR